MLYWQIGKTIQGKISAGRIAGQETGIVDLLRETLTMEYGRGFSRRNLFHMIRLADTFEDERIVQTLSAQLSWSHFIEIIYQKDPLQRQFYAEMTRVELYLRWLDRYERRPGEDMPIGLILCGEKNREQIELLQLDRGEIKVAKYLVELPPREMLEAKLHEAIRLARGRVERRSGA
jgi:hypothetical protein